jgi:hypothetical protein
MGTGVGDLTLPVVAFVGDVSMTGEVQILGLKALQRSVGLIRTRDLPVISWTRW